MKLNDFEGKFFQRFIDTELDVPVQATLKYKDDAFSVILVPVITEDGYFELKYYSAPPYDPETEFNESGIGTNRLRKKGLVS